MALTKIQPAGIDSSNSTLTLGTSNTTAITIDGSQNVGIGTSTSAYRLDVQSITDTVANIKTTGSIQSAFVRIVGKQAGVDNEWNVIASGNGLAGPQLRFTYGTWTNSPAVVIDTSGNLLFNSGYGSAATAYGCRAWVNFNGSTAAIRASGGVTSVTRNTTGDYTINFSITLPDANYSYSIGWDYPSAPTNEVKGAGAKNAGIATTSFRILYLRQTVSSGSTQDSDILNAAVAIFR
jgi:hypothetical protein